MAKDLTLLLSAISNGNIKAFETFYKMYHLRLFMYARKFLDDEDTALDLIQEFFISFWEKRSIVKDLESPEAYLFRSIHNRCIDYLRRETVRNDFVDLPDLRLKEIKDQYYLENDTPVNSIFLNEIEDIVKDVVAGLPEQCRVVFEMSRKEGYSYQKIGEELNISVRTVESHIYKALKILKRELSEYLSLLLITVFFEV
ncbi:RNA polymerase sigma-70 factor [Coprobacter sp.]|uniref:RNA polymerase sigma-70 factor n=1 Tax=Coprobacter sp. TaxID=1941478 RepID=UPI003AB2C906